MFIVGLTVISHSSTYVLRKENTMQTQENLTENALFCTMPEDIFKDVDFSSAALQDAISLYRNWTSTVKPQTTRPQNEVYLIVTRKIEARVRKLRLKLK